MPFRFPARWEGHASGPNPLSEAMNVRRASGAELLDLTVSSPAKAGIVLPRDWTDLMGGDALHVYAADPRGLPSAREAVAGYYRERGTPVDAEDLVLTAGTSEAYSHLFRLLCEPGDAILVPRPSYPLIDTLAELADLKVRPFPLRPAPGGESTAWELPREALEAQASPRTRVLCLVQPNNPTGSILSPEDATWLLAFAERHDLALIVDEVFSDFLHDGPTPPLLSSDGPLVFTLHGLSKLAGLPQLKLAWIHVAGNAADKARAMEHLEWISDAHLSVGTAPQLACPGLLRRRAEFQGPIRARLRANLATLREIAARHPALEPLWPRGGWCMPIRCAGVRDDEAFAIRLVEGSGVLVQPGYFYEFEDENVIVLSLLPPPDIFRTGVERIAQILNAFT